MHPRDDPYWQRYWHDRMRDRKVALYAFAPFLEAAGALLRASAAYALQYRRNHKAHLTKHAADLSEHARILRHSGIGWVVQRSMSPLYSAVHVRTYLAPDKVVVENEEASAKLLSLATEFLFLFEQTFVRIEGEVFEESGLARWFFEKLEVLTDLAPREGHSAFAPHVLPMLGRHAITLECEGLAYQQAMIEDGWNKRSGKQRKKASTLPMSELRRLAEEIGVSPEALHDAFSTEHSNWWNEKSSYEEQASAARECIVGTPAYPGLTASHGRWSWDVGNVYLNGGYPHCGDQSAYDSSEATTRLLIAMFHAFPNIASVPLRIT